MTSHSSYRGSHLLTWQPIDDYVFRWSLVELHIESMIRVFMMSPPSAIGSTTRPAIREMLT